MEAPNIRHRLEDEDSGVVYTVVAYRQLSQVEVIQVIRSYLGQMKKGRRPKRGQHVEIQTIIGAGDQVL